MADKMLMLALSPTMEEGTIVSWHKKEGDKIENGDVVCEVETDKATMDYEAMQEGTLLKILIDEGENAAVEQPIALIGEEGEDISKIMDEISAQAESSGQDQAAKEGSDDKSAEAPAEKASAPEGAAQEPQASAQETDSRLKASPLARNMAQEAGIDLARLQGSGPEGRIVKRDVEKAKSEGYPAGAGGAGAASTGGVKTGMAGGFAAPAGPSGIEERRIPVGKKRKIIAQRLAESKYSAPHYYLSLSVSTDPLMTSRRNLNQRLTKEGGDKLSLNAFLIKLAAEAIKRHPIINASWEEENIHIFGSIDIGLAVALEDGLITPVVRNCGAKGIAQIDRELQELVSKAHAGKLSPEEYTGASFSISNLGSFGIEDFTAIINPPASAILAVGAVTRQPVELEDNSISFDNRMKLTLSCDHRVIDGAVGADFMRDLKQIIEDPLHALL